MKILLPLLLIALACNKPAPDIKVNRFETSFISRDSNNVAKYTIYASTNGKQFIAVKEIIPSPGTEYKLEFTIPNDKMDASGNMYFYLEETSMTGEVSRTNVVTVQ